MSPIEALLTQILDQLTAIHTHLESIAVVSQVTCPTCNERLASHEGEYDRRADGLFVHRHHRS